MTEYAVEPEALRRAGHDASRAVEPLRSFDLDAMAVNAEHVGHQALAQEIDGFCAAWHESVGRLVDHGTGIAARLAECAGRYEATEAEHAERFQHVLRTRPA
jgi:hypothetical protein